MQARMWKVVTKKHRLHTASEELLTSRYGDGMRIVGDLQIVAQRARNGPVRVCDESQARQCSRGCDEMCSHPVIEKQLQICCAVPCHGDIWVSHMCCVSTSVAEKHGSCCMRRGAHE